MKKSVLLMALAIGAALGGTASTNASTSAPSPGVVTPGFCSYGKGYFASSQAAVRLNTFALGVAIGDNFFYDWQPTGTKVVVGTGKNAVTVDSATAAMQQAVRSGGPSGAFSQSATNATDMGTGGDLGAQTLTVVFNELGSSGFVTPVTGFDGLTLVNMAGVKLAGVQLTSAQANALNGQAIVQVDIAAETALGDGVLSYGLSYAQLSDLVSLLNGSFNNCGGASSFAKAHIYQPYVTSNAFAGARPLDVTTGWAPKPTYNTFSGTLSTVPNLGCDASDYTGFPTGNVALIERGDCFFAVKALRAQAAGASAVIIYNRTEPDGTCPMPPLHDSFCESLFAINGLVNVQIPVAFAQRSTGLALRNGTAPVTVFVQQ